MLLFFWSKVKFGLIFYHLVKIVGNLQNLNYLQNPSNEISSMSNADNLRQLSKRQDQSLVRFSVNKCLVCDLEAFDKIYNFCHFVLHSLLATSCAITHLLERQKKLLLIRLNKYETDPNFIQLNQNLTSYCLLIQLKQWIEKYAKKIFFHGVFFLIHFFRFEMQMDRPDKSENIFGTSY